MALADLATTTDLVARGVDVDSDPVLADRMLTAASAAIREAAGAPIVQTTSTVKVSAFPMMGKTLQLPGQPVTAVASVLVDGEAVTDYKLVGGALWRWCGWAHCEPVEVTVTMTHGFATIPADIVELVCDYAIAGMLNATEGAKPGVAATSEAIDDYRTSTEYAEGLSGSVFEIPERTAQALRARFGGGVYVTSEAQ